MKTTSWLKSWHEFEDSRKIPVNFTRFSMILVRHGNMSVMIPSQDSMIPAAFEGSRNHGILWNLALRWTLPVPLLTVHPQFVRVVMPEPVGRLKVNLP